MAFQLSPGVLIKERDLTNVVPAVATTIGGIVGNYIWGPVHEITSIDSENNLVERFGRPSTTTFYDFMTAASFLAYGSNCLTIREVGALSVNSVSEGTAVLIKNEDHYQDQFSQGTNSVGPWAAKYAGGLGNSLKVVMADATSTSNLSVATITLDASDTAGDRTTATVAIAAPDLFAVGSGGIQATATATVSGGNVTSITVTNPGFGYSNSTPPTVTVTVDGTGAVAATAVMAVEWEYKDEFDSIPNTTTWALNNGAENDELNILVIDEDGAISGVSGTILEKFAGLSKAKDAKDDVNSTNYYKNVINDRSKWVWWMDNPASGTNWGSSSEGGTSFAMMSVDDADQNISLIGGIDDAPSIGQLQQGYDLFANDELVDVSLILLSAHPVSVGDYVIDNVAEVRKDCLAFISPQRGNVVNNEGDEVVDILSQPDHGSYTRSSYAVMDSGWKYMYDKYNDRYTYVPLNGDVAGCCVITDLGDDPWFSPAGLNRGIIKNAIKLAWSPRKADRDTLYQKSVNPVINTPGTGIVLFGDKTMLAKPSAFNRINVRRLFIVLEKAIATAAKFQLFEFNDAFTRAQFVALVEPFLRDVQGRRGIYDFRVVCNETNNTPQVIDSNEFRADIYIKPAKSINFITLTFIATRTGISFEELGA